MPPRISNSAWFFRLAVVGAVCGFELTASAQLKTALEVRSLSVEKAEQNPKVELTATVIFSDPPATIFVQDDTAGTFFRLNSRKPPVPGDVVKVTGQAFNGLYLPGIEDCTFEVLENRGIPDPIPATYDDLISGRYHYQRVSIDGVVRTIAPEGEAGSVARVAMGSRLVEVHVEQPPLSTQNFVDARVTVAGLAAGHINDRRQLVEPYLRSADWSEFSVTREAVPVEKVAELSPEQLLTFEVEGQGGHRVRIEGVVLARFPRGELFLRDGESAIGVQLLTPNNSLNPGDRVAVVGFPEMSRFSASVVDATLVDQQPGVRMPIPRSLTADEMMDGRADGDLVRMKATLTDFYRTGPGGVLVLQQGDKTVQAKTPSIPPDLVAGSEVSVTGVCQVETTKTSSYRSQPESISLRLRSPEDIAILAAPGWWTTERLITLLVVLIVIVTLAMLWIGLLRRQVVRQTVALRHRIEHEAALEERQRIAREFHDTLEQELAGLSLRLDAAVAHGGEGKLVGLLDGSKSLVSRIQMETRNLVSDLRDTSSGTGDLIGALRELVSNQHPDLGPRVSFKVKENTLVPVLPQRTVHHLKMIAREAIANAMKHSEADQIDISLSVEDGALLLKVADNGNGFEVESETRGKSGHFGCMGIRERCSRIDATVDWVSETGEGTMIEVKLPIKSLSGYVK